MHLPNNDLDDEEDAKSQQSNATQQDHVSSHDNEVDYFKTPIVATETNNQQSSDSQSTSPYSSPRASCPTCLGKGKLSQSQADSVLALIPAGDKRLKPRRTKQYLALTGGLSTLATFLIAFFLWPRSILVSITDVDSVNIHVADVNATYMDVRTELTVINENYFDASIDSVDVIAKWNHVYLVQTDVLDFTPVILHKGAAKNVTLMLRQTFQDPAASKVKSSCNSGWTWFIFEYLDLSLSVSTKLRREIVTESTWKWLLCYNATAF